MSSAAIETKDQVAALGEKYKHGFVTDIEMERAPKGLSEDTVRFISAKKGEPEWMLDWRLAAYRRWREMTEPNWARVHYAKIDYQNAYYYAAPKTGGESQEPGRDRSQAARDVQQARHSAVRAEAAGGRRRGRGVRFRFGRHDLQGETERGGRDFLPDVGSYPRTS